MNEPTHFFNEGFGWVCQRCKLETEYPVDQKAPSRLISEGEAESKEPRLSTSGLATWADRENRILECPTCGARESLKK